MDPSSIQLALNQALAQFKAIENPSAVALDDLDDFDNDPVELYFSDDVSEVTNSLAEAEDASAWFQRMCQEYAQHSDMDAHSLAEMLMDALKSEQGLEETLVNILGYDHLEFVIGLHERREELMAGLKSASQIEAQRRENRANAKKQASELEFGVKDPQYPHVYRKHAAGNTMSMFGTKYSLPVGTTSEMFADHEVVTIPYSKASADQFPVTLKKISELDPLCQGTFSKYTSLNKIQSLIYPVGYETNENMLVCAPTGAGKTDVALLTMLNTIRQNTVQSDDDDDSTPTIDLEAFKIIYVAPLKALAAEIVEKMGSRLAWLGISVRELTGDMQLTRQEISETQVIVTTPEKWDVVTRKTTGDNDLVRKVQLLIIDEVHLLHEDRGAVIESLVARTLRRVESTQTLTRIVGLSATLPNFLDVAEFLRVNPMAGLFFFDSSFRPVPLEQRFVAVRGKAGSFQSADAIDRVSYDKLVEQLKEGHQVMVFVHSRKDTVKTARKYMERALSEGDRDLFDCTSAPGYVRAEKDMGKWKNRDMKELFNSGFAVHHAGMLRTERNQSERLFREGCVKVLVSTATLAWGVNLPAAVVIVKGTQVYDSKKGGFTDLGISDVIQIFGRAGRPQYEKFGTGILCTTSDRLAHYLSAITNQFPIESRLQTQIADNLNAEISSGTITDVNEGVRWLGYTYLYVRMRKNPLAYGMNWNDLSDDPLLGERRRKLIIEAARRLQEVQMIVYDENTGALVSKYAGRVASDYYLLNTSVEVFNRVMNPLATQADVLAMIAMSGEFDSIKFREEEAKELNNLRESVPCQVAGGIEKPQTKTNILLQAFISRAPLFESALVSDASYIGQNAARITRALFLMALNRKWGALARLLLSICKSIERRAWSFEHPLKQLNHIAGHGVTEQAFRILEAKHATIPILRDMDPAQMGALLNNNSKMGSTIARLVDRFPNIEITASLAPITRSVLKVHVELDADFRWDWDLHGRAELFWLWIEESGGSHELLHSEKFVMSKSRLEETQYFDFTVPLRDPVPDQVIVRCLSDSWAGAESTLVLSFQHLIRPDSEPIVTRLLKLRPLPVSALQNPALESIYAPRFQFFNPMQTMVFYTLYHQKTNVLLGSPTGSGKTVAAELAMWAAFRDSPKGKVVYIAPMKALVRERVDDWSERILKPTGRRLVELTGDSNPSPDTIRHADIIITTPEKFDGISRNWQIRKFVQQVSLIIMDEIHLLASDRGPILEMIVSRMNYVAEKTGRSVRLLGMSTAVANAGDLASWLHVKPEGLFNFPSSVRPVPLEMYIDGFTDMAFGPLMKTMNKPAFLALKSHSPAKPVLVFVASRRQTRLTAEDFIHLCGMEDNPRRFLHMDDIELEQILARVKDDTLKLSLQFGIGLHHAGLVDGDRKISHELFAGNKIQILIATSTLAWGVNLPAHLVVIKGTQFYDHKILGYRDMELTDVLQMMGRAGRPAFDTTGIAMVFTKESTKAFYKHFLNTGFPVESSLHKMLEDHLGAEISAGMIRTKQDALDFLTWTFLFRRIHKNPTYYRVGEDESVGSTKRVGGDDDEDEEDQDEQRAAGPLVKATISDEEINGWIVGLVDRTLDNLVQARCLTVYEDHSVEATPFLDLSSYYYLSHRTMKLFVTRMVPAATFEHCLTWQCLAAEYDELAWRHNEDLVNAEMSKNVRYTAVPMSQEVRFGMIDPHVKSYLLMQAFLTRMELPLPDYIQDRVSVLDQSLRILQAAVDTSAELGYLDTCLTLIRLMQCVKQACWDDIDPVSVLPGLSVQAKDKATYTLDQLARLTPPDLNKAMKQLGVLRHRSDQFRKVVTSLPAVDIKTTRNDEGKVTVSLAHVNRRVPENMYAPLFPKAQKESWFVIAGRPANNEVLALKRLAPPRLECELTLPSVDGVALYCVNDALALEYVVF